MKQRWLISCVRTVGIGAGAHQVFCNLVLEEDPVMWLVKQVLTHQPTVLISIFLLDEVDSQLFEDIKNTINP